MDILTSLIQNGNSSWLVAALLPPLGYVLSQFPALFREDPFRKSLTNSDIVVCAKAAETLASMLSSFLRAAGEAADPAGGSSRVGDATKLSSSLICEASQRVVGLQTELFHASIRGAFLAAAAPDQITEGARCALQSLSTVRQLFELGVLHPTKAVPHLLTLSMAAPAMISCKATALALRLIEKQPPLLASRLGEGLRAASHWMATGAPVLGICSKDGYRFSLFREAFMEHLTTKSPKEQLLDTLLREVKLLLCADVQQGDEKEMEQSRLAILFRAELLFGLLTHLPFRNEQELLRLVRGGTELLSLEAPQLLFDAEGPNSPSKQEAGSEERLGATPFGLFPGAALLARLLTHWLEGGSPEFSSKMLDAARGAIVEVSLPSNFSRRPALDLAPVLEEFRVAEGRKQWLATLTRHLSADSPLLIRDAPAGLPVVHGRGRGRSCGEPKRRARSSAQGEEEPVPEDVQKDDPKKKEDLKRTGRRKSVEVEPEAKNPRQEKKARQAAAGGA